MPVVPLLLQTKAPGAIGGTAPPTAAPEPQRRCASLRYHNRGRVFALACGGHARCGAGCPEGVRGVAAAPGLVVLLWGLMDALSPWSCDYAGFTRAAVMNLIGGLRGDGIMGVVRVQPASSGDDSPGCCGCVRDEWRLVELKERWSEGNRTKIEHPKWNLMMYCSQDRSELSLAALSAKGNHTVKLGAFVPAAWLAFLEENFYDHIVMTYWACVTYADHKIPEGDEVSVCICCGNRATVLRFDFGEKSRSKTSPVDKMVWALPQEDKELISFGAFLAAGRVLPLWCPNVGNVLFLDTVTKEKIGENHIYGFIDPLLVEPISDNLFILAERDFFSLWNLESLDKPLWTIQGSATSLTYVDGHVVVMEGEFSRATLSIYTPKGTKVTTLTNPPGKCLIGRFITCDLRKREWQRL
ncbi:hypothetical protein Pelo_9120 [Pelomyxa schiedti]|nr:hypothetical protein Pelo_9120 [Pelomyxa schiedti]